jgi:hypothetical protein
MNSQVAPMLYLTLVYFQDIKDPSTIKVVYTIKSGSIRDMQEVKIDRLEEVFGSGAQIKNMTIEMINGPLEWKLDEKLKWIETMSEKEITNSLSKSRYNVAHPVSVTNGVKYYILRQGYE